MKVKPNILLLTSDQQRFDTIGSVNAPFIQTPHLDRLAGEGGIFLRAHTPNPVCISARANILTGLPSRYHHLPWNTVRPLPCHLPTLPRILSEGGYATAAIGKMHFHPVRESHGFTYMKLMEECPGHIEDDDYLQYLRDTGLGHLLHIHGVRHVGYQLPQRSLLDDEHHGSTWVARETCRFIEANRDRPWFAWASWIAPHPPANVSDDFAALYQNAELPPVRGVETVEKPAQRRFRELYYAAITQVDKNGGLVLDKLEALGLNDRTLVIFASDHGEMLGDHGYWTKELPYEGSVRIPFILRFPGIIPAGTRSNEFVDLNDILPTALDAAGIDVAEVAKAHHLDHFPGDSLLHPRGHRDRALQYAEWGGRLPGASSWIMLRDDQWKYIHRFTGGEKELFNLHEDPHETQNLASSTRADAIQALNRLEKQLVEYEQRWGMPGGVSDNHLTCFSSPDEKGEESPWKKHYQKLTPPWSIHQWPLFTQWTEIHRQQAQKEIERVVCQEPLGAQANREWSEEELSVWWQEWRQRGGDEHFFYQLFGKTPPSC